MFVYFIIKYPKKLNNFNNETTHNIYIYFQNAVFI